MNATDFHSLTTLKPALQAMLTESDLVDATSMEHGSMALMTQNWYSADGTRIYAQSLQVSVEGASIQTERWLVVDIADQILESLVIGLDANTLLFESHSRDIVLGHKTAIADEVSGISKAQIKALEAGIQALPQPDEAPSWLDPSLMIYVYDFRDVLVEFHARLNRKKGVKHYV